MKCTAYWPKIVSNSLIVIPPGMLLTCTTDLRAHLAELANDDNDTMSSRTAEPATSHVEGGPSGREQTVAVASTGGSTGSELVVRDSQDGLGNDSERSKGGDKGSGGGVDGRESEERDGMEGDDGEGGDDNGVDGGEVVLSAEEQERLDIEAKGQWF